MRDEDGREWGLHGRRTLAETHFAMRMTDGFTHAEVGHVCNMHGNRVLSFCYSVWWPLPACYGTPEVVRDCYTTIAQAVDKDDQDLATLIGLALKRATETPKRDVNGDDWLRLCQEAIQRLIQTDSNKIAALLKAATSAEKAGNPMSALAILGAAETSPAPT